MNHDSEKCALEDAALGIFMKKFNEMNQNKLHLYVRNLRPDFILKDTEEKLVGLEIAHLYYDSKEAKMLLGRDNNSSHGVETINELINELNNLIVKKARKYRELELDHSIELLIRNASPIFRMNDILRFIDEIIEQYTFEHIWFISRDENNEWILIDLVKHSQ
ncbi:MULTISPECIES: hypothetical protein [unclassified Paenibacillus]|uniref:hypothetical protein n=1 Tax=unclassified Paenibacillus TaxID=185978 RepID=UPI00070C76E7|nr:MULTISPECIES: hypothetical protein [unclassified Paenibacillus]KQX51360.1 hypothetical protein ASD40_35295 [Paenibacillus sp. Root444D2]KRE50028.1 hypothetical protein ASG85_21500 [Paenibacillus sp. Soil724D2]